MSTKGVNFHDAKEIWGKGTYETEDYLINQIGVKGAKAVVIGPAGENAVKYALIENEKWRSAGRTGVGAVLGSKKVKGLVFHGNRKRELADPGGAKDFARNIIKNFQDAAPVQHLRILVPLLWCVH